MSRRSDTKNIHGYFGIGIYMPKTSENIGTLWRSAYQLGASFIFVIGKRYKKQIQDTLKVPIRIPLFQFDSIDSFLGSRLYDCKLVCIENCEKSTDLRQYSHPKRCAYLLGSEDNGLPREFLNNKNYDYVIIPSIRTNSYNVAMAGTITIYDRFSKSKVK